MHGSTKLKLSRTVIYSRRFEGLHFLHVHRRIFVFSRVMGVVWLGLILKNSFLLVFLGDFENLPKRLLASSCLSVRPSVCMEQLGSHWTGFHEIWYLSSFRKHVDKIKVSLKFDNHKANFTNMTSSRWFFLEWEMFQTKVVEKIKTYIVDNMVHAHCLLNN